MKRNIQLLFISICSLLLFAFTANGQSGTGTLEGTWTVEPEENDLLFEFSAVSDKLKGSMTLSEVVTRSELTGFSNGTGISFSLKKKVE